MRLHLRSGRPAAYRVAFWSNDEDDLEAIDFNRHFTPASCRRAEEAEEAENETYDRNALPPSSQSIFAAFYFFG